MKVIVYGGTNNKAYTERQMSACERLGEFLGKRGATIMTGACGGYPYFVGKAAIKHGGKVIGFTPAVDLAQHKELYKFPVDGVTKMVYVKSTFPTMAEAFMRRSMDMTPFSDLVIALGGSWGTFGELYFSFMLKRTIILVEEFEGAVKAFEDAYEFFGKRDVNPSVHNGAKIIRVKTIDECMETVALLL